MDTMQFDRLVQQLTAGFEALQDEYEKLFDSHSVLERKLATAREQYNELAKLYGTGQTSTPPLSLSSSPGQPREDEFAPTSAADMLDRSADLQSNEAAKKVKTAIAAANSLRNGLGDHGVKIWAGPSADRHDNSSSLMPSISESPLEQDFTVEGVPSKLGCPFASMANKKLSSHAASVLSRYNHSNSAGAHGSVGAASTPHSNASRINGRDSLSQRQSRKGSMVDPIKAEICGMSDHDDAESSKSERKPSTAEEKAPSEKPTVENAEAGVCPIRFLDQHSPEEVATYFEKHKHELPRSHEVCVMRYQSNEDQIKELDAKYGNLVSMIQGLGQKHKDMLPEEPDDAADDDHAEDGLDDAKVRKWASSVSAQAPGGGDEDGDEDEEEERQPHFERPLRDIRVGESPSRPWGIPVPAKYLDMDDQASQTSSKPAVIAGPAEPDVPPEQDDEKAKEKPKGKCPFDHAALAAMGMTRPPATKEPNPPALELPQPAAEEAKSEAKPKAHEEAKEKEKEKESRPQIVFNGPVFIGYSPEDAVKFLKEAGMRS